MGGQSYQKYESLAHLRAKLLAGSPIQRIAIRCARCHNWINTEARNIDCCVEFGGRLYHQECLALSRLECVRYGCRCARPSLRVPLNRAEAQGFPLTFDEGGKALPICRMHLVRRLLNALAFQVRRLLNPTEAVILSNGCSSLLLSGGKTCFRHGYGGELLGVRQVDWLPDACRAMGYMLFNELNGSWEAGVNGELLEVLPFTMGVVEVMLHGRCWNCEQDWCDNCREEL